MTAPTPTSRAPEVGDLLLPPSPEGEPSGFNAMGRPVPMVRRSATYEALKRMGVECSVTRWSVVGAMAARIERDDPHGAMAEAGRVVDVTGMYRALSHMLT